MTGLLTALLFIGTSHGEEVSELEEQLVRALMQDSEALMETFEEEDNEIAEEQKFPAIVIKAVKTLGCTGAKAYCNSQAIMMDNRANTQGWIRSIRFRDIFNKAKSLITGLVTKDNFCAATNSIC